VNQLDILLVILIVTAVVGGYRLGFLARATSWIGLVIGLLVASYFLPDIVSSLQSYEPSSRFLIASGVFLGAAFLGQAIGLVLGANLHRALPLRGPLRQIDRGAGAAAGIAGVLVTIWLLTPAMADVPGWPARQARSSRVAKAVSDMLPQPPDTLGALRRLVGDDNFPHVFGRFEAAPDTGPAPVDSGLAMVTANRVISSTVKVEGIACGRQQDGTGFTVAPGVVVTNAHVVAGETETEVIFGNDRASATVTSFDSDRDLALLRVPGLRLQPLPIASAEVGTQGAVFGHPRGQDKVAVSPAVVRQHVEAVGRDLYDSHTTRRQVFILAADLEPGDSGGPLVDASGRVVGVAFAIAPDRPGTAYALTDVELRAAIAQPNGRGATGSCLTS
jgi:S1-C subfamily serine protease